MNKTETKKIHENLAALYNNLGVIEHRYLLQRNNVLRQIDALQMKLHKEKDKNKIVTQNNKIVTP